jgi:NADH:ubiquinone oxidoreductase subunit 3 (subunit A)
MFSIKNELFSISILLGIAIILSCILLSLAYILSTQNPTSKKLSAYECGFQKFMSLSIPFDIHFYRVGILFLIFYVEIAFLFP